MTRHEGVAHYREVAQLLLARKALGNEPIEDVRLVTEDYQRPGPVLEVVTTGDTPPGVTELLGREGLSAFHVGRVGEMRIAACQ